ncbi:hypothetical protein Hte_010782 [Hypoxylon texense]
MESPAQKSLELYPIGVRVFEAFEELLRLSNDPPLSRHRDLLVDEEQRFRLWAHSLGLRQHGHMSLDYRVRDVTFIKERLAELLSNLQEHLERLVAIVLGKETPIEDCDISEKYADEDGTDEYESSATSNAESPASEESYPSSFHEVDFRFDGLTENLNFLYNLAAKIRNPRNRPQSSVNQLYKHIPDISAGSRAEYIAERENFETTLVACTQQRQIIMGLDPSEAYRSDELTNQYATTSYWLIQRAGIANARRKQQFIYWKEHSLKLGRDMPERKPATPVAQRLGAVNNVKTSITHDALAPNAATGQAAPASVQSVPTSATNLKASAVKSSVFSNQGRASTVMDLKGEKLEWPPPPTHIRRIGGYFTCPCCEVLCPERYLRKDAWRVHLIHDLQPYHCTYEDCQDPDRLYGTREDWVNHENQHARVWHCHEHKEELEFETQAEYVEHLKTSHPDGPPERYSQELVATAVGPSLKECRPCPFCPFYSNAFPGEITQMQKHIMFHLERLALLALPLVDDNPDGSDRPQRGGRKGSILNDFVDADRKSFTDFIFLDKTQHRGDVVSKVNLGQLPSVELDIGLWLSKAEDILSNLPNEGVVPAEEFPSEYEEVNEMAVSMTQSVRTGLDDPRRVRQIRDRGEGDFLRASGSTSQLPKTYVPLPDDVDLLLDNIAGDLDRSKVVCALDPNKDYLPRCKLPEILTPEKVRTIVSHPCFKEYRDKDRLTRDICFGSSPCLKLLAILIGIGKVYDLPKLMSDGLSDKCLPMDIETSAQKNIYCQYHKKHHSAINEYPRPNVRAEFSRWSYSLIAPYIRGSKERHSHYVLRHGDVFPIEVGTKMYEQPIPGFSELFKVKIDSTHCHFDNIGLRHADGFFALKRLASHDREDFNLELSTLLFCMDNAHSSEVNMHLIQPLASFEVLDTRAGAITYYLLFDWAQGNLEDFWKINANLIGDMRHSLWMSQQLHGICSALQCVHNERQATSQSTAIELYGRHGDIKPENLLWFHPARQSEDLIVLSDFGLGRLRTQLSRSNQDARNLPLTSTYLAPEFDLADSTISRATDIFSLGCVFLEYVTWFLLGLDAVENQFPGRRTEMDIYGFEADKFFTIHSDGHGGQQPFLKPQVMDWIAELQHHGNCSRYLYELLEIIRDKMLEPGRERRINALQLTEEMQKLRQACERNDSFYLKAIKEEEE